MRKRLFAALLALVLVLALLPAASLAAEPAPEAPGGAGTELNPYLITKLTELLWFRDQVNEGLMTDPIYSSALLTCDLDLSGICGMYAGDWTPIGTLEHPFNGVFDGDGHTVTGLYAAVSSSHSCWGFFGHNSGTVKNLAVSGTLANSLDGYPCGGVCGVNDGTLSRCASLGSVTATEDGSRTGGVCGVNRGTLIACHNAGTVSGAGVGGICGQNGTDLVPDAAILSCFSGGQVLGEGAMAVYGSTQAEPQWTCASADYEDQAQSGVVYMTDTQLSSGEACWYLNAQSSFGPQWFQDLGTDAGPVLSDAHAAVYKETGCTRLGLYKNQPEATEHLFTQGRCACGRYEAPELSFDGWYLIATPWNLAWFREEVNSGEGFLWGRLTDDLDLSPLCHGETEPEAEDAVSWTPIGTQTHPFMGKLDGGGHAVTGLYIHAPEEDNQGLFGYTDSDWDHVCEIQNLTVAGEVTGGDFVGGLCGHSGGQVTGCVSSVTVTASETGHGGGLCGCAGGTIQLSDNRGAVTAGFAGGLCGQNAASLQNCSNTGTVTGALAAGGLTGVMDGAVLYCLSTGTVTGAGAVTGLYGQLGLAEEVPAGSYYLDAACPKSADKRGSRAVEQLQSGEVCWLLNNQGEENTALDTPIWYQTLGEDDFPVRDSARATVYRETGCTRSGSYKNTTAAATPHSFDELGMCLCGQNQPAVLRDNGTPTLPADDYYEISNPGQLVWFRDRVNSGDNGARGKLVSDVDLATVCNPQAGSWTPIGREGDKYTGVFDGDGHTVKNLYIEGDAAGVGLFGSVTGTLQRLGVTGSVQGGEQVGGLCGILEGGILQNCFSAAAVQGVSYVGGLCGCNNSGIVRYCYTVGTVTGDEAGIVGGVCGSGDAVQCYYLDTSCDYAGGGVSKTEAQFSSGEVCWLLNNQDLQGGQLTTPQWYQKLSGSGVETLPSLDSSDAAHRTVYHGYAGCSAADTTYMNAAGWGTPGHIWSYTARGTTVTAACARDRGHTASLTLAAPSEPVYNGAHHPALFPNEEELAAWTGLGLQIPDISYGDGGNVNAGTVTATVTVGSSSVSVTYDIAKATPDCTPPTGLTATCGATLGEIGLPFNWAWVDSPSTSAGPAGENRFLARYDVHSANYIVLTVELTVTVNKFPYIGEGVAGLTSTHCTAAEDNNGAIAGVTSLMEYQKDGGAWQDCPEGTLTGLAPGVYRARVKATDTVEPSPAAEFTIQSSGKIQVYPAVYADGRSTFTAAVSAAYDISRVSTVIVARLEDGAVRTVRDAAVGQIDLATGAVTVPGKNLTAGAWYLYLLEPGCVPALQPLEVPLTPAEN